MSKALQHCAASLKLRAGHFAVLAGRGSAREEISLCGDAALVLLETILHNGEVEAARATLERVLSADPPRAVAKLVERLEREGALDDPKRTLRLGDGHLILTHDDDDSRAIDLTTPSELTGQVLRAIAHARGWPATTDSFDAALRALEAAGVITPAPGRLDWGDLLRVEPVCAQFGFTRGTPLDRHYLDHFIDDIRDAVTGDVLEIGGLSQNRDEHRFAHARRYVALDVHEGAGVDHVGDAHDHTLFPRESFDVILAFNVLEHCIAPWRVVENMHAWLRPGGRAYCMVPAAQRVHDMPRDYWRPTPRGLESIFSQFSKRRMRVFGNPATVIASYLGIAREELPDDVLDRHHPDYPVAICLAAEKD